MNLFKTIIQPGDKVDATPVDASIFINAVKIAADIDPALLLDETIDIEVGAEFSFDGKTWENLVAVRHDGASALRGFKINGVQPGMPYITSDTNVMDILRERGAKIRTFTRVHPRQPGDVKDKVAVNVGAVITEDNTIPRRNMGPIHHSAAFDASSSTTGTGTSATWTHVVTGSNTVLHAGISQDGSGTVNMTCTFNSVSMVRLAQLQAQQNLIHFRLVNPSSGSHSIAMSWTGSFVWASGAMSFTGVDQTTPDSGTPQTAEAATGSSLTVNVSSSVGDLVLQLVSINNGTVAGSAPGAGQTTNALEVTNASATFLGMSYAVGATTVTMSETWSTGSTRNAYSAINIKQSGGTVTPNSNFFALMK